MTTYSYARCLENAYKVNWRIDEVLGERRFDRSKRWLPWKLSGAAHATCLDEAEKRKLTHVEMAAYAHLFAYVEEFIAPTMNTLAKDFEVDQRTTFDALTNFVAEEVKHMNMFRRLRDRVNDTLGIETTLLGDQAATARFVLSKNTGAVLLLIACIEWFTQLHYTACFEGDAELDELTRHVFRMHWLEESQHAQMDHLETLRAFAGMSETDRDRAVDDLIELVGAVDGLLQVQVDHDLANFRAYLGRELGPAETDELRDALLRAKRWTFLESGITHPRFQELFAAVTTPAQQEKVAAALSGLLSPAAAS